MNIFNIKKLSKKSFVKKYASAQTDLEREKIKQELQNIIVNAEREKEQTAKKFAEASAKLDGLKEERNDILSLPKEIVEIVEDVIKVTEEECSCDCEKHDDGCEDHECMEKEKEE
jgi:hypothetical protein